MMSREKMEATLRSRGIDFQKLAGDPAMVERAVGIAYEAIPIPWRWLIGRSRLQRVVTSISDRVPRARAFYPEIDRLNAQTRVYPPQMRRSQARSSLFHLMGMLPAGSRGCGTKTRRRRPIHRRRPTPS
jgi:hypothetical protein